MATHLGAGVTSSGGRAAVPQGQWWLLCSEEHRADSDLNRTIRGLSHLLPHFVSLGCFTLSLKPAETDRASMIVGAPFNFIFCFNFFKNL